MDLGKQDSNKAKRKIARYLSILGKDYPDVKPSKDSTKFVFIGNAGLTTNADEVCLTQFINSIGGGLQDILLLPGKSYSFVTFISAEEAEIIVSKANGQLCVQGTASPIYMTYVDKVPKISAVRYEHPPGLHLFEDFVSQEEEAMLLNLINWDECTHDKAEGSVLKHRQVRHFGYEFLYGFNSVDKASPLPQKIPEALSPIVNRIVEKGIMQILPDQLTINRYLPGHGIPPHVDTHCSFTDEILSLSVGSGIMMDFRHVTEVPSDSLSSMPHCGVYLKPRSLCAMTGSSRYEWSHGICPRMTDVVPAQDTGGNLQICPRQERVSFTFRKIRDGNCQCGNPHVCDAPNLAKKESSLPEANPTKLEKEHVLAVYDQIASHFSDTRHKPWPQVLEFVDSLPQGSFLLDVGCGNGKYLGHNKSLLEMGCDTSFELTKICRDRGFEVLNCNCLELPYRNSLFDAVICIAVIHHLASEERRIAAVQEMVRVLRQGGRGLIYVWALEQKRGKKKSSYLKQNKANWKENQDAVGGINVATQDKALPNTNCLPVHTNRTEFIEQDMLVPWKLKPQKKSTEKVAERSMNRLSLSDNKSMNENEEVESCSKNTETESVPVFHRFYHVFKQSELESLCEKIEGVEIVKSYYDEGNWCVIFQKNS